MKHENSILGMIQSSDFVYADDLIIKNRNGMEDHYSQNILLNLDDYYVTYFNR